MGPGRPPVENASVTRDVLLTASELAGSAGQEVSARNEGAAVAEVAQNTLPESRGNVVLMTAAAVPVKAGHCA